MIVMLALSTVEVPALSGEKASPEVKSKCRAVPRQARDKPQNQPA